MGTHSYARRRPGEQNGQAKRLVLVVRQGHQVATSDLHPDDRCLVLLCLRRAIVLLYDRQLRSKSFLSAFLPPPDSDVFVVVLADGVYRFNCSAR